LWNIFQYMILTETPAPIQHVCDIPKLEGLCLKILNIPSWPRGLDGCSNWCVSCKRHIHPDQNTGQFPLQIQIQIQANPTKQETPDPTLNPKTHLYLRILSHYTSFDNQNTTSDATRNNGFGDVAKRLPHLVVIDMEVLHHT